MYHFQVEELPKPAKRQIFLNIALASVTLILLIVCLALHNWFEYCFWEFGLVYSSSIYSLTDFQKESSIGEVYSDACNSMKEVVENYCNGACYHIQRFAPAGGIMIAFGVLCVLLQLFIIYIHLKKYRNTQYKFKRMTLILIAPTIVFCIGYFLYLAIIAPTSIDSTANKHVYASTVEPTDFGIKAGNAMAISQIFFFGLHAAHGFIFTRKFFS